MFYFVTEPEKVTELEENVKSTIHLVLTWTAPGHAVDDFTYIVRGSGPGNISGAVSATSLDLTLAPGATYHIGVAARKNGIAGEEETILVTMCTCV